MLVGVLGCGFVVWEGRKGRGFCGIVWVNGGKDLQVQVGIDEVVEAGKVDAQQAEANEDARRRRRHPVDVGGVGCPGEPAGGLVSNKQ